MERTCWMMVDSRAEFASGPLAGVVDWSDPRLGMSGLTWNQRPLAIEQLAAPQWQAPALGKETVEDTYCRSDDLVATYAETDDRPMRPQVYWRVVRETNGKPAQRRCVELIVSMQTSLLDCDPRVEIISRFDRNAWSLDESSTTDDCVSLAGPFGVSLLLTAHPTDRARMVLEGWDSTVASSQAVNQRSSAEVRFQMFDERLEKGVIRRGRLRAWFSTGATTAAVRDELIRQFLESPLPLTT